MKEMQRHQRYETTAASMMMMPSARDAAWGLGGAAACLAAAWAKDRGTPKTDSELRSAWVQEKARADWEKARADAEQARKDTEKARADTEKASADYLRGRAQWHADEGGRLRYRILRLEEKGLEHGLDLDALLRPQTGVAQIRER